jgi:hypothetical protein|tara:strand:+ start:1137 stop:1529 length:393 start_codon:yes stop_codon:yes gene_type:complete
MKTLELRESNNKAYNQLRINYGNRRAVARKEGYPDGSSKDFFKLEFPEYCIITGHKLDYDYSKPRVNGGGDYAPSFDKINPELGYIEGNVRVVSFLGNRLMSNINSHEDNIEQLIHFRNFLNTEIFRLKK